MMVYHRLFPLTVLALCQTRVVAMKNSSAANILKKAGATLANVEKWRSRPRQNSNSATSSSTSRPKRQRKVAFKAPESTAERLERMQKEGEKQKQRFIKEQEKEDRRDFMHTILEVYVGNKKWKPYREECPEGHTLTQFRADESYQCARCSREFNDGDKKCPTGTFIRGCKTCKHAICNNCFPKMNYLTEGDRATLFETLKFPEGKNISYREKCKGRWYRLALRKYVPSPIDEVRIHEQWCLRNNITEPEEIIKKVEEFSKLEEDEMRAGKGYYTPEEEKNHLVFAAEFEAKHLGDDRYLPELEATEEINSPGIYEPGVTVEFHSLQKEPSSKLNGIRGTLLKRARRKNTNLKASWVVQLNGKKLPKGVPKCIHRIHEKYLKVIKLDDQYFPRKWVESEKLKRKRDNSQSKGTPRKLVQFAENADCVGKNGEKNKVPAKPPVLHRSKNDYPEVYEWRKPKSTNPNNVVLVRKKGHKQWKYYNSEFDTGKYPATRAFVRRMLKKKDTYERDDFEFALGRAFENDSARAGFIEEWHKEYNPSAEE